MIENFNKLELRANTKCDCGYEFTLKDITGINRINQHGFYGNLVKDYSPTVCPKCKKEYILLLKQKGQTWEIVNIATVPQNTTNEIEKENNEIQKFVCPQCGMICKSQLGLNSHLRSHQSS